MLSPNSIPNPLRKTLIIEPKRSAPVVSALILDLHSPAFEAVPDTVEPNVAAALNLKQENFQTLEAQDPFRKHPARSVDPWDSLRLFLQLVLSERLVETQKQQHQLLEQLLLQLDYRAANHPSEVPDIRGRPEDVP